MSYEKQGTSYDPGALGYERQGRESESSVDRCRRYRRRILEISRQVTAAHVAPAFSCLEIVDALYHEIMNSNDIFIMSKGHGYLAQCVVLEDLQWPQDRALAPQLLDAYCLPGGKLGAHPDYEPNLGIHASTGSLGHGLGIAAGQALAEKMKGTGAKVYVLLSDGECQEGSTWEAAMVAANLGLGNLIVVIDANNWGGMDQMRESHPGAGLFRLADKFKAFGWLTNAIDGHDSHLIATSVGQHAPDAPSCIVCRTTKGKGVSFIEKGQPLWHYRSPNDAEYKQALEELA